MQKEQSISTINPSASPASRLSTKKTSRYLPLSRRLSKQHTQVAKKIHQVGYIYALHGLLDGGIAAYGSMKFFFDVLFINQSSTTLIHDWLQTPEGISIALAEAMAFVGFSLIANMSEENATNAFRRAAASFWPYCRSAVSELKKTSRAVSNTVKIASFFKEQNLDYAMIPFGLTMGAVSIVNRVWFRRMQNQRQLIKDRLQALLKEISAISENDSYDPDKLQGYYQEIPSQSKNQQKFAYVSAAYTGLMEGVAFYIGILTFISLTSPAFIPLAACCLTFAILSIATRIHEEYEHQRELEVHILIIKLRLKQKEVAALTATTVDIKENSTTQLTHLYNEIFILSKELDDKAITLFGRTLKATRQGLSVYAFINKIILGATIFFSAVPIALVISSVGIGISILLFTTIKAVMKQIKESGKNLNGELVLVNNIPAMINQIVDNIIQIHLPIEKTRSFWRSWFDVAWAFFSGLDKGRKNIGHLLMVSFAERSLHDDYMQSPIMINLSIALGVLSSIIFSLRTYAMAFGTNEDNESEVKNLSSLPAATL